MIRLEAQRGNSYTSALYPPSPITHELLSHIRTAAPFGGVLTIDNDAIAGPGRSTTFLSSGGGDS